MLSEDDKVLELTFQTSKYGTFNADALYEVLDGKHDATIDELISIIKAHDQPILFRPNNEMNGDWCSYNAMYTHKDAEVFRSFLDFGYMIVLKLLMWKMLFGYGIPTGEIFPMLDGMTT